MRLLCALISLVSVLAIAQTSLTDYGGNGNGIADNSAAWSQAIAAACGVANTRTLKVPKGDYRFTAPPAQIACALNIEGEGKAASRLIKDYSGQGGYFVAFVAGEDPYGGGSVRNVALLAGNGSTDGIALWVKATPDLDPNVTSLNRHGFLADNVLIGRLNLNLGSFAFGVYLDGYYNTGPGAMGIRSVSVRNTTIATATSCAFYVYRGFGIDVLGVEAYAGNANICIDGGSSGVTIVSRTLSPSILNGSNVWKFP